MQRKQGGQKRAFSVQQIQTLEALLTSSLDPRRRFTEYTLMRMAVDTMLRASDLLKLRVRDVFWENEIVEKIELRQQKTDVPHIVILSEKTRNALKVYLLMHRPTATKIGQAMNVMDCLLFPFEIRTYQRVVKSWAKMLQLEPRFYSSHSLRRTKAKLIYDRTQNIEVVRQLLGQSSIESTRYYLGVELEDAHRVAREIEI